MTVRAQVTPAICSPIYSPILSSAPRLILPYTDGLLLNLIPDTPHTDLDGNGRVVRVRGSGPATSTQDQTDDTKRFGWSASSVIGGRPALSSESLAPYLLTPSGASLAAPFVVYAVIAPPLAAPTILVFDGNAFSTRAVLAYIGTNTWQMVGASGTVTANYVLPSSGALFTCVFDGSSSEMRIGGSTAATGTISTGTLSFFTIGARFSLGNTWGGLISYFGVQTGHPSASNLALNENAIRHWFGV